MTAFTRKSVVDDRGVVQRSRGRAFTSKRALDDFGSVVAVTTIFLALVFLLLPLLVTALMAFDSRSYLGPLPPPALSVRWFSNFFSQETFISGLRTSLELAALATAISVTVGAAAAIALDRAPFPGRGLLVTLFLSPLVIPPVVIGFSLLLALSQAGVLNGFVRLLCGHVIITLPFTIRATLASLVGRDASLTEAALVLGATERQAFWSVTLPLIRTGIITGAIFAFAVSLDDVAVSTFLTDPTTYTLPVALLSAMRANFDLTIAAAAVMLMALTAILIFILDRAVGFNRLIGQGMFRPQREV
jgi:putative spermidine/putrescine transport system permease protein